MAQADLYIVKDDKRKANKDLSNVVKKGVNIFYKDSTEFLKPIIIMNYDGTWNMRDVNYVYLTDKNRYYFVSRHEFTAGKKVIYYLLEDVRKSHIDGIKNLTCTVTRNENLKNGYLPDSSYKTYAYEQIVCKSFPNKFNNNSIILMTVG